MVVGKCFVSLTFITIMVVECTKMDTHKKKHGHVMNLIYFAQHGMLGLVLFTFDVKNSLENSVPQTIFSLFCCRATFLTISIDSMEHFLSLPVREYLYGL